MKLQKVFLMVAAAVIAVGCGNRQAAQQQESEATDSVRAEVVDPAIELIDQFYKSYVFGDEETTEEVVKRYCTKKLAKKLADDYEYEGGGYAIWDFRSGAQDGDSDVQKVNSIVPLGEGRYKVNYNDMGIIGACTITVVVENGSILFDEIN